MRLSVDNDDPGYAEWAYLAKIFFNGAEAHDVVTADEEKGVIVQFVRDDNGLFQLAPCKTKPLSEVRYGEVRIDIDLPKGWGVM